MSDSNPIPSFQEHQAAGLKYGALGFAVITMSDSRTPESDTSGQFIREAVTAAGHQVVRYALVKDDPQQIAPELDAALADPAVAVVVTNGGTGISLRDNAFETISARLDKRLDGFGELFRMLSYHEIGAAAMLSRAAGGIARGKVLFSLPGSTKAVRLGMEKLILPQAGHVWFEVQKHAGKDSGFGIRDSGGEESIAETCASRGVSGETQVSGLESQASSPKPSG